MIDDWLEIAYEDIEVAHLCYHQKNRVALPGRGKDAGGT